MKIPGSPIFSCAEARDFEARFFGGDEVKEWAAMQRAGRTIATAVLRDFEEIGGFPTRGRLLVLAGKGHNGGDALIAARVILEKFPEARPEVLFVLGERSLRPLATRAWRELIHAADEHARRHKKAGSTEPGSGHPGVRKCADLPQKRYDLCLDGIFGFQFRAPVEPRVAELLTQVNALSIRLRAAVDLPSAGLFQADFTYATGSVKDVVIEQLPKAGRVRYLDLGFFTASDGMGSHELGSGGLGSGVAGVADPGSAKNHSTNRVLTSALLAPLASLRTSFTDKRTYGHVFVVGGSRHFPGAVLMAVLAALRSGAGLVTAFVPESLVATFAARAPEAMWVGWPETPDGGLALEGEHLLRDRLSRATALAIGPGLGREAETLALAKSIVGSSTIPLVIDADALQPDIVGAGQAPRILTPHVGEMARIGGGSEADKFVSRDEVTTVLKGPLTTVLNRDEVYHSFFGGPVLARGGSGDLLAGLTGGLLAQTPREPLLAACRAVVWHGRAADLLARAHGQAAVQITQLLDFLPAALRQSTDEQ